MNVYFDERFSNQEERETHEGSDIGYFDYKLRDLRVLRGKGFSLLVAA
jgi:hypothetical protein